MLKQLKSMFALSPKCREVRLTERFTLDKDGLRFPLTDCPVQIHLDDDKLTLDLIPEPFLGNAGEADETSLLLYNPVDFHAGISGFIRLKKSDHLVVGRDEEHQQTIFDLPDRVAKRQLSITHDGDSLMIKDLSGNANVALSPVTGESQAIIDARTQSLREIYRIFGGPLRLLSPDEALDDLNRVNAILAREPLRPRDERGMPGGVVKLPEKMVPIIIGDLHAQVDNLLTLLTQNGFLEMLSEGKAAMLFLGDAVHSEMDDGLAEMESSLLMMDIIFRLKLWFPQQVFYVRGNHDSFDEEICKEGVPQGLLWARALRQIRGEPYKEAMDRFYGLLPYVALSKDYVACHAAPPKGKVDMDMLINIYKYPGLIREITCNRLYRPNRAAGYTRGDVKRFRKTLNLDGKAELFVGHTPLTRYDTLWLDVGGIEHHDVVFSGNIPWIGVITRVEEEMIPMRYRSEALIEVINKLDDVELYNELEHLGQELPASST